MVKPLIVLLVYIAYAVPASAGRPLARSAPDTGKSLAMMISPLPVPPPPPCEQAAARNAPTSMSEALLSHRLDKGVLPPTIRALEEHFAFPDRSAALRGSGAYGATEGASPRRLPT